MEEVEEEIKVKIEESIKKSVIRNSFWNFFVLLFNRIGALVFTVILARFLLPEKYGLYSIVLSIAMILVTLSDLGINTALIRYLSGKSKANKSSRYTYMFNLKLLITSASSLFLLIASYPISIYLFKNSELTLPLMIAAFYVFFFSLDAF